MKLKTKRVLTKHSTIRHYKRSAFVFIALFGVVSGIFAQSAGMIFSYHNAFASTGWNWVNTNPGQMQEVTDFGIETQQAVSKDGQTLVYGSFEGIRVSHDGGVTWLPTAHPSPTKYYEVFTGMAISANGQHIWAEAGYADSGAETYISHDRGVTWAKKGNDAQYATNCYYSGWVSNDGQTIVCNGVISRDGGTTYNYLDFTPYSVTDDLQTQLADDYISTDAGVTWNQLPNLPGSIIEYNWGASQISSDGQVITIGTFDAYDYMTETYTGYRILVSEDGGQSWVLNAIPGTVTKPSFRMSPDGQKLYLFDNNKVQGGGVMYTSLDLGVTWQARSSLLPYMYAAYNNAPISENGDVITIFTYSAVIFRSIDGGATWSTIIDRGGVTPVAFSSDGNTIFGIASLGGETNDNGLVIPVFSTDNGITWQNGFGAAVASMSAVFQVCTPDKVYGEPSTNLSVSADGQTFILPGRTASDTNCYLVSHDGGSTWQTTPVPSTKDEIRKILVSKNGQHMVTNSTTGKPIVSHNGGTTWTQLAPAQVFDEIQGMSDDGQKMTASTTSNTLLYSTNGGVSWTNIGAVISSAYTGVWGSDWRANVSGDGSRIIASDAGSLYTYVSTNNGVNWTRSTTSISVSGNLNTYHGSWYVGQFSMSENGLRIGVTGSDGTVLTSLDGGITYVKQDNVQGINYFWDLNTLISADGSAFLAAREDAYLAVARYGFNPQPILNITGTPGIASVTLNWNPSTLVDSTDSIVAQEVQYRAVGSTTWVSASQSIAPGATNYTVHGLTPGQQYEFKVRAQNINGGWTPWARTYAPLTSIDISGIAPDGSLSTDYALDANDKGDIWFAHTYYPCGNSTGCAANGWTLKYSNDNGATWNTNTMTGLSPTLQQTTQSPLHIKVSEDGQTILVSGTTMYISRDGGANWSNVSSIGAGRWYAVDMSDDGQNMIASEWGGARQVSVSSDGGQTWTDTTLPYSQDSDDVAYVTINNNGTIYVSTYNDYQPLIKSTNLGQSWVPGSSNMPRSLPMPDSVQNSLRDGFGSLSVVDISNDEQHIVYMARFGFSSNDSTIIFVTENGGQDWVSLSPYSDSTAFDPEVLTSGDEGYDFAMAFTPSGRAAYITGLDTGGDYGIVLSNYSNAFATPLSAPQTPVVPQNTLPSTLPLAPNTGIKPDLNDWSTKFVKRFITIL